MADVGAGPACSSRKHARHIHEATENGVVRRIDNNWVNFFAIATGAFADDKLTNTGSGYGQAQRRLCPIHKFGIEQLERQIAFGQGRFAAAIPASGRNHGLVVDL